MFSSLSAIFFPPENATPLSAGNGEKASALTSREHKTILLVDDDPGVVAPIRVLLTDLNYHVLTAMSGQEAIQTSRTYDGEIALLLSDFQMPGMSGVQLATELTADRPSLKVLLMSGFPEGMLVLNEGWHFLATPFISSQLTALIVGLIYPMSPSRFVRPSDPAAGSRPHS